MEASLFGTVLFAMSNATLFVSTFCLRKSKKILNGVSWLILSLISVLCYGAMMAGIVNVIGIPVNIISMGIIYFVTSILLCIVIKKNKKTQKYKWEVYDFIYVIVFGFIIFFVSGKYFTSSIQLMFYNSDAAVHFKNAMYVLREQSVTNMFFAPLHNALIMEMFMPFVAEVNLYKIFILIDAAKFLLETLFFMVLIRDFLDSKTMKIIGFIIAIIYTAGYPMNSYLYSFFYWGLGVMLMGYIMLMLRYYKNREIDRKIAVVGMMLACGALPVTYMIFGPIIYIISFIVLFFIVKKERKIVSKENIILALKIYAAPTLLAIYYCYFDFLRNSGSTMSNLLNLDGGVYRQLFINFIWTLPFVIYMLIKAWKNKKSDEITLFTIFISTITIIMFLFVYKGKIGVYYFYKLYYPLWLLFHVLTIQAIKELWVKSKELIISLSVVFFFLVIMCFGGLEQKIIDSERAIIQQERTSGIFDLYLFNIWLFEERDLQYPPQYFEICNYVIEELREEEKEIPLLATIDNYRMCYWYEGITGQNCKKYYGWLYSFEKVQEKIAKKQVNYFVVYKDSPIYEEHKAYFEEFEYAFENDYGIVAIVK